MEKNQNTIITVTSSVNAPVDKVWKHWTTPESITKWNNASDDWHTPRAENDLRNNGRFSYRMEARDGSMGFDFEGTYDEIVKNEKIQYTIGDGRKVEIIFIPGGSKTDIVESFEAENLHPIDQQRKGWQSILDNFKKFTESAD
jgi:uncharacterized protein YndB with AHSA1/START domain